MNYFILASHGGMAKGIKDTIEVIIGKQENISAYSFYRQDDSDISEAIEESIQQNYSTKNVYVMTDIFGGSVNNDVLLLLKKYPNLNVITGFNLPLIMSLIVLSDKISSLELERAIEESRKSIIDCGLLVKNMSREEEELR